MLRHDPVALLLVTKSKLITDASIKFGDTVSQKTGEECCKPYCPAQPVEYKEWNGSMKLDVGFTFNMPGWNWDINDEWKGIYKVVAEVKLGPEVQYGTGGNASVDGHISECKKCLKISGGVSTDLTVGYGGKLNAQVTALPDSPLEVNGSFGANANLSASSSVNATGSYGLYDCPGASGKVTWGGLSGTGTLSVNVLSTAVSISKSVTLLEGGSYPPDNQ